MTAESQQVSSPVSSPNKYGAELSTPLAAEKVIRPPDAEFLKGVRFLRLLVRSKCSKNIALGFSSIRNYASTMHNKTLMFGNKLLRLFHNKQQELSMAVIRKLATHAARNRAGYLRNRGVLENAAKRVSLETFLGMLDRKHAGCLTHAFQVLHANKSFFDRLRSLKRNNRLRFLLVLFRTKIGDAWSKLHSYSLRNPKHNALKALKSAVRLVNCKTELTVAIGFQFVKKCAQWKKAQQDLKPENRGVSEREQKLMDEIEQLTQESNQLKKQFESDMKSKEQQKEDLTLRLEQLTKKNAEIEEAIKNLKQVKIEPIRSFTAKDVYERVYHNFLYFLRYAEDEIPKDKLLDSLVTPMCRLSMPIDVLKQQNEALLEVIEQYKGLNLKIPPQPAIEQPYLTKPYEHLLRQNSELYCALAAMIESNRARQNDKDFVLLIGDFMKLEQQFVKARIDLDSK